MQEPAEGLAGLSTGSDVTGAYFEVFSALTQLSAANDLQIQWMQERLRRMRQRTTGAAAVSRQCSADLTIRLRRAA